MLDALYVLVVADTIVVRDPLVVPYMTTGVVTSAVVHSTIIWLHRGRHFVSCQAVMMHDALQCYGSCCTIACRNTADAAEGAYKWLLRGVTYVGTDVRAR